MDSQKFKAQLREVVRMVINDQKKQETVAIGIDCLWQFVANRISRFCPDAPVGTNCAWVARQTYNEIVQEPAFANFVTR